MHFLNKLFRGWKLKAFKMTKTDVEDLNQPINNVGYKGRIYRKKIYI